MKRKIFIKLYNIILYFYDIIYSTVQKLNISKGVEKDAR